MSIGRLVRLCLVMSSFFWAHLAHGSFQLLLHPIELVGYEGAALQLKIAPPCGGTFFGLIAREAQGNTLELAAVMRQDAIVCTAVPQPLILKVQYLDLHRFESVAAMITGSPKRVEIRSLESLHAGASGPEGVDLIASSQGACGRPLGTILHVSKDGALEVGLVDLVRRAPIGSVSSCPVGLKHSKIRVLTSSVIKRVRPLLTTRGKITRQFELRLAPTRLAGLNSDKPNNINYFRSCQDAPIGVITKHNKGKKGVFEVGVLVARYFNAPCTGLAQGEWATLSMDHVWIPEGMSVIPASDLRADEQLQLETVLAIEEQNSKNQGHQILKIAHSANCGQDSTYVVHARDHQGQVALGLLRRSTPVSLVDSARGIGACSSEPSLAWVQAERTQGEAVYPLSLHQ
jgi:hypothetical protein